MEPEFTGAPHAAQPPVDLNQLEEAYHKFPMGSVMNRSLTIRTGQCHVQRYMRPLLQRIQSGEIDPSFVISHHLPLDQAPEGYAKFLNKEDQCTKIVLKPH